MPHCPLVNCFATPQPSIFTGKGCRERLSKWNLKVAAWLKILLCSTLSSDFARQGSLEPAPTSSFSKERCSSCCVQKCELRGIHSSLFLRSCFWALSRSSHSFWFMFVTGYGTVSLSVFSVSLEIKARYWRRGTCNMSEGWDWWECQVVPPAAAAGSAHPRGWGATLRGAHAVSVYG